MFKFKTSIFDAIASPKSCGNNLCPAFIEAFQSYAVGAVNPKGKRGEISLFLSEGGRLIKFQKKGVFEILRNLRDRAHLPANAARRREMSVFFEEFAER